MTALVKQKAKGTVLAQSVAAVYVAMAALTSIDISGEKNETYAAETLDDALTGAVSGATAVYKTKEPSGYIDPPIIKATGFFDPGHATYTALYAAMQLPLASPGTQFKITYTDIAPTSDIYGVTGIGVDKKVEMGKAVMANIELVTSGAPSGVV